MKPLGYTADAISKFAPGERIFDSEAYASNTVMGWFTDLYDRHHRQYQPHLFNNLKRDFVFPAGLRNRTITSLRKRMETLLSRARVPSFNRNAAEGRSTKGDGSRDVYNCHTDVDALKVALILNLPPLISDWSDPLPEYPGERVLDGLRKYRCTFDAAGYCKPVLDLKRALVGNPVADLALTQMEADRNPADIHHQEKKGTTAPIDSDDIGYDSDAPISSWAGKRPFGNINGNIYNGPVTIHVHIVSSKKPHTTTDKHDPEVAAYLAAISGNTTK